MARNKGIVNGILRIIVWPLAVLTLSVFFSIFFRKSFVDILSRVRSIGRDGLSVDQMPNAQIDEKQAAVAELMRLEQSPLIQEVEASILAGLQKSGLDVTSDATKVLARHLASTQVALEFEQVYNVIFGSQIFFLKKLNEDRDLGVGKTLVDRHFENIQKLFPDSFKDWDREKYLDFLFARILIRQDRDIIRITVRGGEFLTWLTKTGRSESRPL